MQEKKSASKLLDAAAALPQKHSLVVFQMHIDQFQFKNLYLNALKYD